MNLESLKNQLPAGAVIFGIPESMLTSAMVKRFGVTQAAIAKSRASMVRAGIRPDFKWTDFFDGNDNITSRPAAMAVMDRPAPAPRSTVDLKFYDGFQLSGVCHCYGQHLDRGAEGWVAFQHGCFRGVRSAPLRISHDADGQIVALAEDVTYRDDVDAMGFPQLTFFARRIVHSDEMDHFLSAYMVDGKLRNIHLSIGADIVSSHTETVYNRQVRMISAATLDHVALLEPSKDRPGCGGTYLFTYGRP